MKKEILHMKINADLKKTLQSIAEKEQRSLSNLVAKVLHDFSASRTCTSSTSSRPGSGE